MSLSDTQLIFLDNFIYLNNLEDIQNETLLDAINFAINNIERFTQGNPAAMSKEEWIDLLTSFKNNPANTEFLKNYKVTNYVTNDSDTNGFRAACFVNVNDTTDVAAIFRGTYGGGEWKDDFIMANKIWSEEMDAALQYINNLPAEYGNNIAVSGHSKGGNKSQYVTILTDRIGRCVSFDGQGFSQEFIDFYADDIAAKRDKITSISFKYDYVNALLYPIASKIMYVDGNAADEFPLNHCPNMVFDENGNLKTCGTDVNPAFYHDIIANTTQVPAALMPDDYLDTLLNNLSDKIVVPAFDTDPETEVNILEFVIQNNFENIELIKYLLEASYPTIALKSPNTAIDLIYNIFLNKIAERNHAASDKKEYMNLVGQYVNLNKFLNSDAATAFNQDFAKTQLISIRKKLLDYGKDLFSDPAFYKNLSAEDTMLLSEFLEISKNDVRNTKDYDLMLDRLSYILERFGETKTALYDPLVIDMGKTGFFYFLKYKTLQFIL